MRWRWKWTLGFLLSTLFFASLIFSRTVMNSGGLATMVLLTLKMRSIKGFNVDVTRDMMSLGGLLDEDSVGESSCLSKRELALYRKSSPYAPSSYLVSRLRNYEAMHRKCGPNTQKYDEALKLLLPNVDQNREEYCKYLIWIPPKGLGNKLVSLVSTFLYALLTDRVLLLEQQISMKDLLCEPFENSTWLLPEDFPLRSEFGGLRHGSPFSYGNMLKKANTTSSLHPPFVYLHLAFDYDTHDMLFFCDDYQISLPKVPWLVTRSDQYFAPSLFLMPAFEEELRKLFPEKDTVFHHLGRYLFHPSNLVWGLVKRYYDSYLANADERIGIQIRDFSTTPMGFTRMKKHIYNYYLPHFDHDESSSRQIRDICNTTSLDLHMMDRIVSCFLDRKLLPKVVGNQNYNGAALSRRSKAVLVTSLSSSYYDKISDMYWDRATETGEGIGVFQPSHEGIQHSDMTFHNAKAWAEIYLLSLMDVVITSPVSTFGYVAQGLGGRKAWMINGPHRELLDSEPSCFQVSSMEPCFHNPPYYDCKARGRGDTGSMAPYVQHCEDLKWGLKLVDVHHL